MALNIQTKQSGLRPPAVPNFPFSSPITEEVSSPSCSSEERDMERDSLFEAPVQELHNPFTRDGADGASNQAGPTLRTYLDPSSAKSYTRKPAGDRQHKSSPRQSIHGIIKKRERPVGLNLITDFSRNEPKKQKDTRAAPFVDLNDLKLLSKARDKERSTQKIRRALRKRPNAGYQELEDESIGSAKVRQHYEKREDTTTSALQRSSHGPHELSPSDGPIVIGIKVPYDGPGNDKNGVSSPPFKEPESSHSQPTPITPSILITPAIEDPPWAAESPEHHRPRPPSSVYSELTPYADKGNSDIPPVPAIPELHKIKRNGDIGVDLLSRQSTVSTRKQRSFSTGTVFEEDDSPRPRTRRRSYSNEGTEKILHRLSVNTDTNRHQSQGWWTYLLSPLLSRSSTIASRKISPSTERPPVPPLSATSMTSKGSSEKWWDKETSSFSPETPKTCTTKQGDMTTWPGTGERSVSDNEIGDNSLHQRSPEVLSFANPGRAIAGSAAEYYQACAHELFSRAPYFECINHVCSITPENKAIASIADEDPRENNVRGLAIVADPDPDPATVNRNNPFLVDTIEPNRERSNSDSTLIDEESVASPSERSERILDTESRAPVFGTDSETSRVAPMHASFRGSPGPFVEESQTPLASPRRQSNHTCAAGPPPYSYSETGGPVPRYRAIFPPGPPVQPQSPGPISPGFHESMASRGSIPMSDIQQPEQPLPTYKSADRSFVLPPRPAPFPVTIADMTHPTAAQNEAEARRRKLEKKNGIGKKLGVLWRGRGLFKNKGCSGRPGREGKLRRRWYVGLGSVFLVIVVLSIALATTLTRKGDGTPVQSQWLNLTGYPPMPTGISTIAGPEAQVENTGCVHPSTMWSCALPKEQQAMNSPYSADEPNFRVQIRFHNGTYGNATTTAPNSTSRERRYTAKPVTAGHFIRRQMLWARDLFTETLFDPSPAPPSINDQKFLGNTTDNNTVPFAGEETPFFITILSPDNVATSRLTKRADDSSFPNLTSVIPAPDTDSDGTAAPANLYPLPVSQPVRLYNRGLSDEHYGFYTYFDRSIFLKSTAPLNASDTGEVPDDLNGGSAKSAARVRCTWAQTRFLVQIWTQQSRSGMALLGDGGPTSADPTSTSSASSSRATGSGSAQNSTSSSANDFTRPGSFPYPVSITLDRHGGNAKNKMVYCYGMDTRERIVSTEKKLQLEFRGFGGHLINPASGVFNITGDTDTDSDQDGVDGGTGGCSCQWRNWISSS